MSAFIVISVKESLNWIVDGIKECRPHNPDVVTHISCGKVIKKEGDEYLYEYTTYSKHAEPGNADGALKTTGQDTPRNIFKNQIAQFLKISGNDGSQINIFLLDNPVTEDDFKQSDWLMDEIRSVYLSHSVTTFQLIKILFSYQIDRPTDVSKQVPKEILKKWLVEFGHNEEDGPLTRILYVDNQNRHGAAICLDKQGHDIMLPRMLCDLMMLMSNKNDTYNTTAAINSPTNIFAVGYSECMYYHDDVFRYYRLANDCDLKEYMLEVKNDVVSLDFEKEPFGLEDRLNRLASKYEPVPFDKDIALFPESIDKEIDDVLNSLKEDIVGIKDNALKEASEKDKEATEKARMEYLAHLSSEESNDDTVSDSEKMVPSEKNAPNQNDRKGCNFLTRLFCRNKQSDNPVCTERPIDPRVAHIVITEETKKVQRTYPDFINREQIYENVKSDDDDKTSLDENVTAYGALVKFVQSAQFIRFLKDKFNAVPDLPLSWKDIRSEIESIHIMYEEREGYEKLKSKVCEIKKELEQTKEALRNFRLTTHCTSVDNLIDMDKLREFHEKGKESRIKSIIDLWRKRNENVRTMEYLNEDLTEQTKWDLYAFYYIKWDDQFDFIKQIDLTSVCRRLINESQPFVNTYTLSPIAQNLTTYCFYTDNADWKRAIEDGYVDLENNNKVSSILSTHICSKICMFQFLQMSSELIEGLTDCY